MILPDSKGKDNASTSSPSNGSTDRAPLLSKTSFNNQASSSNMASSAPSDSKMPPPPNYEPPYAPYAGPSAHVPFIQPAQSHGESARKRFLKAFICGVGLYVVLVAMVKAIHALAVHRHANYVSWSTPSVRLCLHFSSERKTPTNDAYIPVTFAIRICTLLDPSPPTAVHYSAQMALLPPNGSPFHPTEWVTTTPTHPSPSPLPPSN